MVNQISVFLLNINHPMMLRSTPLPFKCATGYHVSKTCGRKQIKYIVHYKDYVNRIHNSIQEFDYRKVHSLIHLLPKLLSPMQLHTELPACGFCTGPHVNLKYCRIILTHRQWSCPTAQ